MEGQSLFSGEKYQICLLLNLPIDWQMLNVSGERNNKI